MNGAKNGIVKDVNMLNKIIHFFYSLYNPYPCGRTNIDKHLCCKRKITKWNSYLTKDKMKCYCRFCNNIHILSNYPIDLKHPYGW